jgi:hypothetical protein
MRRWENRWQYAFQIAETDEEPRLSGLRSHRALTPGNDGAISIWAGYSPLASAAVNHTRDLPGTSYLLCLQSISYANPTTAVPSSQVRIPYVLLKSGIHPQAGCISEFWVT